MSQNDWTGLEGLKDDELIREFHRRYDPLTHSPLETEIVKRLEDAIDAREQLDAIDAKCDDLGISTAGMMQMADCMIDCPTTTCGLLNTLREHDIEDIDQLNTIINRGKA